MINIERTDYPFQYGLFALTESLDQFRFDTEVNSMLESYDIIINEDGEKENIFKRMWEAIKRFIGKIVDAIKGLFGKFKKNTEVSSDEDKKFFEDNKDIILNRKTTEWAGNGGDTKINDYYDIKYEEIEKITVPDFDEQKIKSLANNNKDTVIAAFDNFSKYYKDKQKGLNDNVVSFILGEKTSIKASQLDMKKMYEFAIGIDALSDKIQNAINKVDENAKKANVTIDKIIKENETIKNYGQEKKDDNQDNKQDNNSDNNGANQESFSFNDTLLYYFSEVNVDDGDNGGNSGNDNKGNGDNSGNDNNKNGGDNGGNSGNDNKGNNQEEQKLKQCIEMFWKLSADLVSAQFKVARQAYSQCRDLIRIHVNKINEADGKKNNGGDNGGNSENGGDNGGNSENGGDNSGNSENGGNSENNDQQQSALTPEEQKEFDNLNKLNKNKLTNAQQARLQELQAKINNEEKSRLTPEEQKEYKRLLNMKNNGNKMSRNEEKKLDKLEAKKNGKKRKIKEPNNNANQDQDNGGNDNQNNKAKEKDNNGGKTNKKEQSKLDPQEEKEYQQFLDMKKNGKKMNKNQQIRFNKLDAKRNGTGKDK